MNIDKQIEKIIDKVFIQHNLLYMVDKEIGAYETNGSWDLNFVKLDLVSQIKQSILKAIMERMPKEKDIFDADKFYEGKDKDYVISVNWSNPRYNEALNDCKSVIKELLQTKTNE